LLNDSQRISQRKIQPYSYPRYEQVTADNNEILRGQGLKMTPAFLLKIQGAKKPFFD
jgi:hypothetical protein